ncbi:hypothetical protein G6F55_013264 [Rhizopus delemar]|nr:hypothetical protein G6F55_013264 [Rhizopus delemar]
MLACFSQVSFTRAGIADQGPLVSLLTTVFEDATGDQGDEEPFIFISDDDSDSESDENDTSAPSTPPKDYIITILPGPILAWYNTLLEQKPETTWNNFKSSFIERYGINPVVQKEIALNALLGMKYHHHEDIHDYIQRFNDLRAKAKMQDIDTLKWCLTDPLPADLFKDVEKDFRGKELTPEEML